MCTSTHFIFFGFMVFDAQGKHRLVLTRRPLASRRTRRRKGLGHGKATGVASYLAAPKTTETQGILETIASDIESIGCRYSYMYVYIHIYIYMYFFMNIRVLHSGSEEKTRGIPAARTCRVCMLVY